MATTAYSFVPLTAPTAVNAPTGDDQFSSDTVTLGNGDSIAFYGNSTLSARLIGPNGAPIGSEATIATGVDFSLIRFANAAVLSNGTIVVTWADNAALQQSHYRIYDPNLNPLTPVETIPVPQPGGVQATNHPDVSALAGGGFVITFEDDFSSTDHDIFAQRYTAAGVANGSLIAVDKGSGTFDEFTSVAGLADGGFAVAHDRLTAGSTTMWESVRNADGTVRLADTLFDNLGTNSNADVVALPSGGFAVNYTDNSWTGTNDDITTLGFNSNGVDQSVSQDTVNPNSDVQAKGTVSSDGYEVVSNTVVVGISADIFGTLISPDGTVLLRAGALDTGTEFTSAPVWIDASRLVMTESTIGTGDNNGAGFFGVASIIFEVLRTTSGDSATPLDFSGDGIDNLVTLGSGNDTVFGGGGLNYITTNGGNDVLIGGAGDGAPNASNSIYALGGNDYLQGGTGSPSDVLVATGAGNDTFYGGSGNNYIVGGTGQNTIVGGGGALQTLYGNGSGGDYIVGGSSASASNVLGELGTGPAQLWGGPGNNYEVGGPGDDLVVGGNRSDYLFGGAGNDTIYGGNATDYIYPGPGNDFIWTDNIGSQSTDYIYEGVGTGVDTIADFTPGDGANHDVLVLTAGDSELTSFADVQAKAFQAGIYTVLPLSATDQIFLYNVQPFQLTANDFIFN